MLYIVYILIDGSRATEWVQWMVDVHIPGILATGCFIRATLVRDADADRYDRVGYRVYFRSNTEEDVDRYQLEHARVLRGQHADRYAGAFSVRREVLPMVSQASFTP